MSEEVDRALTRYGIWLGLSIGPEMEEADDDDLLPAGLQRIEANNLYNGVA
jgi:hypothetical protein